MATHLSFRLCWHDSGWNGRICKQPTVNVFCCSIDHIREGKDETLEMGMAGKPLCDVDCEHTSIPCVGEVGTFSEIGHDVRFVHPLKKKRIPGYTELGDCFEKLPAYCFCPAPYRWLMVENYDDIRMRELLQIRDLTEEDRHYSKNKRKPWIDDVKLQEKLLQAFWNKLEDNKSFVVFYSNSIPGAEDTPRVIVGIGRIKEKLKMSEFGGTSARPGPNYVWQRRIVQNYPAEGFRLPYQEYIAQGQDLEPILFTAPKHFDREFKYVAEHVSDSAMLAVAEQLSRIIERILSDIAQGTIRLTEDWQKHRDWIQRVLGELWENRGQYPGIGSVLRFLGFHRGMTYHQNVLMPLKQNNEGVLQHVLAILDGTKQPEKDYGKDFTQAQTKWDIYSQDQDRRQLLELLMRIELSEDQVDRLVKDELRHESGITFDAADIVANPYLIAEHDRGRRDRNGIVLSEPISLDVIDHAMLPSFYSVDRYQADDNRRVRAIIVEALREAAEQGDTLLSLKDLLDRIKERFPGDRACNPDPYIISHSRDFYEQLLEFVGDDNGFVALRSVRGYERTIGQQIRELTKIELTGSPPDWEPIMAEYLKGDLAQETEQRARTEKGQALDTLYHKGFSILTGRAGTGKTAVLNIFIAGLLRNGQYTPQDFLILAPTGKARVRIQKDWQDKDVKPERIQTIHQHLKHAEWIDKYMDFRESGGRLVSAKVVIVDESSMVAVDLLATLFRSIDFSDMDRLIFVGDPNQLPPIGPGRPLDDTVQWLQDHPDYRSNLVNLKERARHEAHDSACLKLADGFLRGFKSKGIEEVYRLIEQDGLGEQDDLSVNLWDDHDELHARLDDVLAKLGITDYDSYRTSIGAKGKQWDVTKCESWQVLSPTKQKEVSGTIALNYYLQGKFLGKTLEAWRTNRAYPNPFGQTKDVVREDKVIQTRNTTRLFTYPKSEDTYVANGEIGVAVYYDKSRGQLKVSFSDQPRLQYLYYDGTGERSVEANLDLAHAISIHKSQGSDFDDVILVVPEKAWNISTEMMYTAFTRFKCKTHLLLQGGVETLQEFMQASNSDTDRRNTFLFRITVRDDVTEIPYAENRIQRTKAGFLVRSKSEVIIANQLIDAGISLTAENYEQKLSSEQDPQDYRLPDFTFSYKGKQYYWEHLGMLHVASYKQAWQRKEKWYKDNGYYSQLIISRDGPDGSIDSQKIGEIIEQTLEIPVHRDTGFNLDALEDDDNTAFRSSLSWDYETNQENTELELDMARAVAAFMNSSGGQLVIGVDHKRNVLGIEQDLKLLHKQDKDELRLKIGEIVSRFIGEEFTQFADVEFRQLAGTDIAIIRVNPVDEPVYVEQNGTVEFIIRKDGSQQLLNTKDANKYIRRHWG